MARPDPRMVPRLPMARRQTHVTWTQGGIETTEIHSLFCDDMLNLDALHLLVERSEAISEGRVEDTRSGDRLFGSTVITLNLDSDCIRETAGQELSERLKMTLDADARVHRILSARVYREITRLVGHRASESFDSQTRYVASGCTVKIHADFDMPVTTVGVVGE